MARFTIGGRRYDSDKMTDLDISTRERNGVNIEGVYMTPNSRRVFVNTYSIWDRGDGQIVGDRWHEAYQSEIAEFAQQHDCDEL